MNRKRRAKKAARKLRNERKRDEQVAAVEVPLNSEREKYAKDWASVHASHFRSQGHYDWMAQFVRGRSTIIEVGTGDGSGTIALCRGGAVVVSIETNPCCLDIAEKRLREAGIQVVKEHRGAIVPLPDKRYGIAYPSITAEMPREGALLLGGDVTDDIELVSWCTRHAPFDAVACWNIGTHKLNLEVNSSPAEYRLIVQNQVYEMAERILRPGGLLHIVDRGHAPTEKYLEAMVEAAIEGHQDQARVTSLTVDPNIQYRIYEPPPNTSGIIMQPADTQTFDVDDKRMALWSISSHMPE